MPSKQHVIKRRPREGLVRVDKGLLAKLKLASALNARSVADIAEEALVAWMDIFAENHDEATRLLIKWSPGY